MKRPMGRRSVRFLILPVLIAGIALLAGCRKAPVTLRLDHSAGQVLVYETTIRYSLKRQSLRDWLPWQPRASVLERECECTVYTVKSDKSGFVLICPADVTSVQTGTPGGSSTVTEQTKAMVCLRVKRDGSVEAPPPCVMSWSVFPSKMNQGMLPSPLPHQRVAEGYRWKASTASDGEARIEGYILGQERMDGHECICIEFSWLPDAQDRAREGLETVWLDKATGVPVRIESRWGFSARGLSLTTGKVTAVTVLKSFRKMNKAEVKALPDMLRLADVYSGYLGKDVEPTAERLEKLGQALAKEAKVPPNSLLAPYIEAESKSDLAMAKIYARRSKPGWKP